MSIEAKIRSSDRNIRLALVGAILLGAGVYKYQAELGVGEFVSKSAHWVSYHPKKWTSESLFLLSNSVKDGAVWSNPGQNPPAGPEIFKKP